MALTGKKARGTRYLIERYVSPILCEFDRMVTVSELWMKLKERGIPKHYLCNTQRLGNKLRGQPEIGRHQKQDLSYLYFCTCEHCMEVNE